MNNNLENDQFSSVPTDTSTLYPAEDGQPMSVSDLHREQMVWTIDALKTHFSQDPTVYVSGDILMYYVEGSPEISIAPDVLVSYGLGKKPRQTYLVWEEGKPPDFVMEFSSKRTFRKDLTDKKDIYASLNIKDYILYDAEGIYLPSPLIGYELIDGIYKEITPDADGGIHPSALNLDFHIREEGLGIFDPETNEWVKTRAEIAEEKLKIAEAEVAELREQLVRLQARS
ncbi:Uma2 family endonuclease [Candidatus Poribacteria bacterium]|nr:Uma2 family endonuclease [Candidatus Poribacteria bacterium]MYB65334.1 Uma2 family endonuclease [Candidatus Poribacteria bacterium]